MEDDPRVAELKDQWLEGYGRQRLLSQQGIREVDSMVMLRRMALPAWIGSRIESPEPQRLAARFAAGTAELADAYPRKHG